MTELSKGDEEIMRLATADDEAEQDTQRAENVKKSDDAEKAAQDDDTLELGGEDAPEIKEEDKKHNHRSPLKRIDILTARLREAERERDELKAKAVTPKDEPPTLEAVMAKEPKPEDFEFGTADPAYLEARQDWKLDLRDAQRGEQSKKAAEENSKAQETQAIVAKLNDGVQAIEKAGAEKYDDFEDAISSAIEERGGVPINPIASIASTVSPVGADILYHLAKNPDVAEKLDKAASPNQVAILIGEIEGQYLDGDEDVDLDPSDPLDMARMLGRERSRRKGLTKPTPVKLTKAPKQPERQARGSTGQFEVSDDTDDFAAFERKYSRG